VSRAACGVPAGETPPLHLHLHIVGSLKPFTQREWPF
jgi:hypothetical protein